MALKKKYLSPQNEEMVRLVFSGMNATDAYRKTHPLCKTDKSARSSSSEIMRSKLAQDLMKKLRKEAEKNAIITRNKRMEILSQQIEQAAEEKDRSGLVKVIDTLNKMDGAYEPEKLQVEGTMTIATIMDILQARGCRPATH